MFASPDRCTSMILHRAPFLNPRGLLGALLGWHETGRLLWHPRAQRLIVLLATLEMFRAAKARLLLLMRLHHTCSEG